MKVIVDTNGLMIPFIFRLNLTSELERLLGRYEIIVPKQVMKELTYLCEKKRNKEAKAALKLAEKFKVVDCGGEGDDAIIFVAEEFGGCVLTNDSALKKKLLDMKIPVIFLRSESHLEIQGMDR